MQNTKEKEKKKEREELVDDVGRDPDNNIKTAKQKRKHINLI